MKSQHANLLVCLLIARTYAGDVPRPRGVGPDFSKFYKNTAEFTCISNPSVKLKTSQINDDYCDCPDGSDEPGTAACSHLSPLSPQIQPPLPEAKAPQNSTQALPGFYCKNKGHNPSYIPFTDVNDGICDYDVCCDGSDEWSGVGGVKCQDKCKAVGEEWRKLDERRKISATTALKKRTDLVAEATTRKLEIEHFLGSVVAQIEGLELQARNMEKEKDAIERHEKSKVVKGAGKGGSMGVLVGLVQDRLNVLREELDGLRGERNTYKGRVEELEQMLMRLQQERDPESKDEGLKGVIESFENYQVRDKGATSNDAQERDLDAMVRGEDNIPWQDFEPREEENDIEVLYRFEEYLPQSLKEWIDSKLRSLRFLLVQNGILAAHSSDKDRQESQALRDARDRVTAAQNAVDDIKRQQTEKDEDLKREYGPDDVFRPLKGKCVEVDSGEYTYELCWMDKVTQKPKKGGMTFSMGNYARFETTEVDEDVNAEGKGLGIGKRMVMKFENGSHCWQGPPRSSIVVMACAENEEIWKVKEEAKCEYKLEVGTPAVCEPPPQAGDGASGGSQGKKEEL